MTVLVVVGVALAAAAAGWGIAYFHHIRTMRWVMATAHAITERPEGARAALRPQPNDPHDKAVPALRRMADAISRRFDAVSHERDVLQHMLHAMTTGLVFVRSDGRIAMVNEAAERMFRRPRAQWIGREHWAVFRNYDLCVAIDHALTAGADWQRELHLFEDFVAAVRVAAIRPSSRGTDTSPGTAEPFAALILCNDISEWRRLEKMRSDFVANVSHELKTPIAAIRGFAETLLEGDVEPALAEQFLRTIHTESLRMGRLVADLLELSRLEGEAGGLQFAPVELASVAHMALQNLQADAERRRIQIHVDLTDSPAVWADADKLLQVFLNLLANAIQYTPEGGRIDIFCDTLIDQVKVHVKDTGIGIPPADQARVFERFYRVDRDRSRSSGGTGLGLAIVKHIIGAHGGQVGVTSVPGLGSDFWFTLSRLDAQT
ncbi:MAG: PAS domain-containing protein [Alicyclobacillus sp.]|nr:PAS domain-containing protein [Alicyclobacillus sp.]